MTRQQRQRKYISSRPAGVQYGVKESIAIKEVLLKELSKGASVTAAASVAGINRSTAFDWRQKDEEFEKAWDDAVEQGVDLLEDEARRRAEKGYERPVFQGGELVGHVREYSDPLMTIMLKGKRPRVFSDRIEHTGRGGGPIERRELTREEAKERLKDLGLPTKIFEE